MATERSILKNLSGLDAPEEVKERANQIFQKINMLTRMLRRKGLIFRCVYMAYEELSMPQDPYILGRLMGLNHQQVNQTFTAFNSFQTNYNSDAPEVTALALLPGLCRLFGLENDRQEDCMRMAKEIVDKSPDLEENSPKKVAAAILQYYMFINGVKFDKSQFSKLVDLSPATISAVYKQVSLAHNS